MADELSEERRRLIYRYMQETGTADQPTLPSPLPEEVMATADQPRTESIDAPVPAGAASPLWQQRFIHLHRLSADEWLIAFVLFLAVAIGWLVAHISS
jgi:hypothetical protein